MDADIAIDTAYYLCTRQDHWPSIAEFFDYHAHVVKSKYSDRAESHGLPAGPAAPDDVQRRGFAECRAILDGCQPHKKRQRVPDTVERKLPRREDLAVRAANREKAYAGNMPDPAEPF